MAKSKARKYREKLAREGNRNPEHNRSPFAAIDMYTRKTKTKKDYLYRYKHKNQSFTDGNDGSFYFVQRFFLIRPCENYINIVIYNLEII